MCNGLNDLLHMYLGSEPFRWGQGSRGTCCRTDGGGNPGPGVLDEGGALGGEVVENLGADGVELRRREAEVLARLQGVPGGGEDLGCGGGPSGMG